VGKKFLKLSPRNKFICSSNSFIAEPIWFGRFYSFFTETHGKIRIDYEP